MLDEPPPPHSSSSQTLLVAATQSAGNCHVCLESDLSLPRYKLKKSVLGAVSLHLLVDLWLADPNGIHLGFCHQICIIQRLLSVLIRSPDAKSHDRSSNRHYHVGAYWHKDDRKYARSAVEGGAHVRTVKDDTAENPDGSVEKTDWPRLWHPSRHDLENSVDLSDQDIFLGRVPFE